MELKEENYKKTIAIDFDGVIHKYSKGWCGGKIYDEPVSGVRKALHTLGFQKNYRIIIFTTRTNFEDVKKWIKEKVFNGEKMFFDWDVTNKKPLAIAYIDDRGIRFTNWKDILNYF